MQMVKTEYDVGWWCAGWDIIGIGKKKVIV